MTARSFSWSRILHPGKPSEETTSMTTTGGGKHTGEPVHVYTAANDLEAQVIKTYLESNDIPVMLQGEAAGKVFGMMVGAMAEVRVYVPEPLADKAIELLEADSGESESANDQAEEGKQQV
jgi:hypothetical protein